MKLPKDSWFWFPVAAGLLLLNAEIAFHLGRHQQRRFEAICESPGVRCAIQVTPGYLLSHGDVAVFPRVTYELREDGGMQ